jgi:hypothetical protein
MATADLPRISTTLTDVITSPVEPETRKQDPNGIHTVLDVEPGRQPARISGAGQHLLPASVRAGHRPLDHFSHLMTVATGFSLCPPTLTSTFSP